MPTLLIIDDEPNVLYSLRAGLESDELRVLTANSGRQGGEGLSGCCSHGQNLKSEI